MRPLLLMLLSALLLVACRPTPSDPIEYLHREDSIIIQMLSVDVEATEVERFYPVPELTIYGDGTLIYQSVNADGTRLLETTLPEDAVQALLEDIVDKGFLDFLYDQPTPLSAISLTTFIYTNTLDRANAVNIRSAADPREDAEKEFRTVQQIIETLRALDPVDLGAPIPTLHVPETYLKFTHPEDCSEGLGELEILAVSENFARRSPTLEELRRVNVDVADCGFQQVSHVPLLPFYENFPEFDLQ